MSPIDQLLQRALLLDTAPDDIVPYTDGDRALYSEGADAELEAGLWPPDDADPVDIDDCPHCPEPADHQPDTAAYDLEVLCQTVISHTATSLSEFVTDQLPAPTGARAVGCILHLASAENNARFWWQYAYGGGDNTAGYCLYLHHLARGDTHAADWWRRQTRIDTETITYTIVIPTSDDLLEAVPINSGITTILRILRGLTDAPRRVTAMVTDITDYVTSAVSAASHTEDTLPVPQTFAQDLRDVLADAAAYQAKANGTLPDPTELPKVLIGDWLDQHA